MKRINRRGRVIVASVLAVIIFVAGFVAVLNLTNGSVGYGTAPSYSATPAPKLSSTPVKAAKTAKTVVPKMDLPRVTFVTTGVAIFTCTIEGTNQHCPAGKSSSYPLSPDRMAVYGVLAQSASRWDTATVSIEINGNLIAKVTTSPAHQMASIFVYRQHPRSSWVAITSYA